MISQQLPRNQYIGLYPFIHFCLFTLVVKSTNNLDLPILLKEGGGRMWEIYLDLAKKNEEVLKKDTLQSQKITKKKETYQG